LSASEIKQVACFNIVHNALYDIYLPF